MNIYDEAIEEIKKVWNGNPLTYPEHTIKALERAKKEHTELEALKRYPTSDEVCEALSEYLPVDNAYHYDTEYKWFTRRSGVVIWLMPNGELNFYINLPPHLIALIGRFYEGMEKGEEK